MPEYHVFRRAFGSDRDFVKVGTIYRSSRKNMVRYLGVQSMTQGGEALFFSPDYRPKNMSAVIRNSGGGWRLYNFKFQLAEMGKYNSGFSLLSDDLGFFAYRTLGRQTFLALTGRDVFDSYATFGLETIARPQRLAAERRDAQR